MIPELVSVDSVWEVLPPGIHLATLDEIENRFAVNDHRKYLFRGFREGVESLARAGCRAIYLDGSFATGKPDPGDFDACWEPSGVDASKLDPTLLDFSDMRKAQKEKYGGEFFPSSAKADGESTFLEYFQAEKLTGNRKGIVRVQFSSTGRKEAVKNDNQ